MGVGVLFGRFVDFSKSTKSVFWIMLMKASYILKIVCLSSPCSYCTDDCPLSLYK